MTRITGEIATGAQRTWSPASSPASGTSGPQPAHGAIREGHAGPAGKGVQFRSAVRSRGRLAEMAIGYTGFQRPSRLAPATRMAQAGFSGTLTFEPAGAGTRLRWSWDARFTWPLRLLAPVLARVGGRQERATWAGLKRYLESSQHAAGPGTGEQPGPAPLSAPARACPGNCVPSRGNAAG